MCHGRSDGRSDGVVCPNATAEVCSTVYYLSLAVATEGVTGERRRERRSERRGRRGVTGRVVRRGEKAIALVTVVTLVRRISSFPIAFTVAPRRVCRRVFVAEASLSRRCGQV